MERLRHYRAEVASRTTRAGRQLEGRSVLDSHKALMTFFRWAAEEEYPVDQKILSLKRPRVPEKEPTVYHIAELRAILAACKGTPPAEELAVRILVGAGVRASELCGLAVLGPDGLPDLMTDSLARGRVELRVRWDAGAKGRKARRVPITPKLAAAIKRYEARFRPEIQGTALLINRLGQPYKRYGLDEVMNRLQRRVGFRVHAHPFRHTFATVASKLGWNLEHLRAAMGHADYKVLQHYVRLLEWGGSASPADSNDPRILAPLPGTRGIEFSTPDDELTFGHRPVPARILLQDDASSYGLMEVRSLSLNSHPDER